jgi:hypothetical protein
MEWYWYLSGAVTVLFVESVLLNIGLARGWVKFHKKQPVRANITRLYDQDNSGSHKKAI